MSSDSSDRSTALQKIEEMGLPLLPHPWDGIEAVDPEGNVFAVSAAR
jgi:hypothetical protein